MPEPKLYIPKRKLVQILWVDSEDRDAWVEKEDAEKWAKEPLLMAHHRGYVLFRDKNQIAIAVGDHDEQLLHLIKIPTKCLIEVEPLD